MYSAGSADAGAVLRVVTMRSLMANEEGRTHWFQRVMGLIFAETGV